MDKWIREWTTDPEVGVQVQMSKKEILEYSVVCCRGTGYEGMELGGHLEDKVGR